MLFFKGGVPVTVDNYISKKESYAMLICYVRNNGFLLVRIGDDASGTWRDRVRPNAPASQVAQANHGLIQRHSKSRLG